MGKKQHAKDKLYILHTEWKYEHGGFKGDVAGGRLRLPYKTLPFHCCALTLQDFKGQPLILQPQTPNTTTPNP